MVVRLERNSTEDEVGMLCESELSGGSSNVRNMTARETVNVLEQHTERCNLSPHARKICACGVLEVRCAVYTLRRFQGSRHFL